MGESKLLVNIETVSQANRMFRVFKPNSIVEGETYDLIVKLTNLGNVPSLEGKLWINLRYSMTSYVVEIEHRIISRIEPKKTLSINYAGQKALGAGTAIATIGVGGMKVVHKKNGNAEDYVKLPFSVSSKEELYQKYSVIVAIWTSIVAIVISTISLIMSSLK